MSCMKAFIKYVLNQAGHRCLPQHSPLDGGGGGGPPALLTLAELTSRDLVGKRGQAKKELQGRVSSHINSPQRIQGLQSRTSNLKEKFCGSTDFHLRKRECFPCRDEGPPGTGRVTQLPAPRNHVGPDLPLPGRAVGRQEGRPPAALRFPPQGGGSERWPPTS